MGSMIKRCVFISFFTGAVLAFCQWGWAAQPPSPGSAAVTTFTLNGLYELALKHAEQIKIAESELFIAERDKDRAFSLLVPQLSAFGNYTRYSEAKVLQPESAYGYGARFDQSFTLNGAEITGYRIAKKNIEKSRYDLTAVKEAYLYQVTVAYYDVLKSFRRIEIAESNVKRLDDRRDAIQVRIDLKAVPKTELFQTEAQLSGAKTDLIVARNAYRLAKASLTRLVRISGDYQLETPEFGDVPLREWKLDQIKQDAYNERADLLAKKKAQEISESFIDISRATYWPRLSLEGVYQAGDTDPEDYMVDKDSMYLGLRLEYLLYDWGKRKAEVSQAKARLRQAELDRADFTKQVSVEVEQAYLGVITARSAIESLTDALTSAQANYDALTLQYDNGLTDNLTVSDANTLVLEAEITLLDARYGYALSLSNLELARGKFLENILKDVTITAADKGKDS